MRFSIKNSNNSHLIILAVLAGIFFFVYSFLIFGNDLNKFTWPDETANHFFITNFINDSSFSAPEPLNELVGDLLHPRSFNVYNHHLVPGSFLGMLLIYGVIGKIIGEFLIFFLTPLLAVLAGLFFYKILQKIFPENVAFLSAVLFFINPAWWYYASFSMMPNIAFLSFLIFGVFLLLKIDQKKVLQRNVLYVASSAFFIALSLIIRTNEFLWILSLVIFIAIIYYKKIKWYYPIIFISLLVIVFLPVFYFNQTTYGSALSFGYLRLTEGDNVLSQLPSEFKTSKTSDIYNFLKFLILPFGISIRNIITVFNNYFISLFWWLLIPAVLGVFALIKNYNKKEVGVFFLSFFSISLYLLIYYGSWIFADQMTLQLNKIGISYVRYFLPIYILALPLISIFYITLINLFENKKFKTIISGFLILIILGFNVNIVYLSGHDNLVMIKKNMLEYNKINEKVVDLTEDNAVIISQRSDKIFFPQRKVISQWEFDDLTYWAKLLEAGNPLYYYAYEGDDYLADFNYNLTDFFDLHLTDENIINDKESLYKLNFINYESN